MIRAKPIGTWSWTESGCAICGVPVDAQYFDDSSIVPVPAVGREVVLGRFQLHPEYCGVLEYFAQYTDGFARDNSRIVTPGLEWSLLWNKRPLAPYLRFDRLLNPWGFGSFPVTIRLHQSALIELTVRRVSQPEEGDDDIQRVGGRIVGRYWHDAQYGTTESGRRGIGARP
jgi:hypothetical protein